MAEKEDWYKREPRKILDACRGKGTDYIAVYNTILDLMYERKGGCPNDPLWIAGWIGCDRRKVSFLIQRLIEDGKLRVDERNELRNQKADEVLRRRDPGTTSPRPPPGSARGRPEVAGANIAENNGLRKQSKREREKEILNTESASLDSVVLHHLPDFTIPPVSPQGGKPMSEGKKSSASRRAPIGDWKPSADDKRRAAAFWRANGRPDLVATGANEIQKFHSHHVANGSKMANWSAAWVTWYTKAVSLTPKPREERGRGGTKTDMNGHHVMDERAQTDALKMFYGLDGGEPGAWAPYLGGKPGDPDCKIKPELIERFRPREPGADG